VDCAIATVNSGIVIDAVIQNDMNPQLLRIAGTNAAVIGDHVRKIGRTSGLTNGTISAVNAPAGGKTAQVHIKPVAAETYTLIENGKKAFSDHGDSGSVILNDADEIVALLWSGDSDTDVVDVTFACEFNNVLSELSKAGIPVTIVNTPPGRAGSVKLVKPGKKKIAYQYRSRLLATETGSLLVSIFEKHQEEVLDLVNHNRKVTVAWQRNSGPAFITHIAKGWKDPVYIIPAEVRKTSLQKLLVKMAAALKETGSAGLREDIKHYAIDLIELAGELDTIDGFFQRIEKQVFV
jgi:hypothetical protein